MSGGKHSVAACWKGEIMKIHSSLLAPLVGVVFLGVILMGSTWELPSMQKQFGEASGKVQSVDIFVDGLRCRGTSNVFMKIVGKIPGVISVSTFVQEHRAAIEYDPSQIDPEEISSIIDKPIRFANGRMATPFRVTEIKE
jgi:copper chaperone CopZ